MFNVLSVAVAKLWYFVRGYVLERDVGIRFIGQLRGFQHSSVFLVEVPCGVAGDSVSEKSFK